MTFLPVVERELRVASRRAATYWSRVIAAAVVLLMGVGVYALASLQSGFLPLGQVLFWMFQISGFAFVASAGIFLTADCVSEEKREGTLGLLFLTDLRGYDVVLGKLMAVALRAGYGLLAALPIMALGFLVGGMTGGQFWRLLLLLLNTLFFSLTLGLFISSISRDGQRAMLDTALAGGLLMIGFPFLDWIISGGVTGQTVPRLSYLSPSYALMETDSAFLANFWICMAVVHGLAWSFLALASFFTPRSWQEKARTERGRVPHSARVATSTKRRTAWREQQLARNPFRWLAGRLRWTGRFLWMSVLATIGLTALAYFATANRSFAITTSLGVPQMAMFLLFLLLASHSARFFLEAARNGMLELALVSPARGEQIVAGHWWALRRAFAFPFGLLLALLAVMSAGQIYEWYVLSTAPPAGAGTGWTPPNLDLILIQQGIDRGGRWLGYVTTAFALGWFGMWMGLTSRKASFALIKTVVFVQVIPGVTIGFLAMAVQFGVTFATGRQWMTSLLGPVLNLAVDVAFITLARRKVLGGLRNYAAGGEPLAGVVPAPPPLPAPAGGAAPP